MPNGISKWWERERAANLRVPVAVKADPALSDILSGRTTLCLMGSNTGVSVFGFPWAM